MLFLWLSSFSFSLSFISLTLLLFIYITPGLKQISNYIVPILLTEETPFVLGDGDQPDLRGILLLAQLQLHSFVIKEILSSTNINNPQVMPPCISYISIFFFHLIEL